MKKSLIAIAALAAVGAASAQSSVTLYGLADVYAGQSKQTVDLPVGSDETLGFTSKTKSTGFKSGGLQGSRIGVKGVEDLGNGLKAVFNYELGFNAVNGNLDRSLSADAVEGVLYDVVAGAAVPGAMNAAGMYGLVAAGLNGLNSAGNIGFNRRAVVGLQGDFGSVLLGRDYTPLFNLLNASTADALSSFDTTNLKTDRVNGVHYAGNFSGVGVQAFASYDKKTVSLFNSALAPADTINAQFKSQGYGLGVSYANGPFMVGAAAQYFKNDAESLLATITSTSGSQTRATAKTTEVGVGGSYDFGPAQLFANYVQQRTKGTTTDVDAGVTTFAAKTKAEEANIGVKVPFGAASLIAEYGHNRVKAYNADGSLARKAKGNDWLVGANYAFSKRTDVYARVGRNNDLKTRTAAGDLARSGKTENVAVGLRHKF
ncbi:MAG: porin [Brachymonas denitrificans]|uniref:porin n=1 Tax=Brachymonas denitrificans TaxID=28220 RepID=UPI00352BE36A